MNNINPLLKAIRREHAAGDIERLYLRYGDPDRADAWTEIRHRAYRVRQLRQGPRREFQWRAR